MHLLVVEDSFLTGHGEGFGGEIQFFALPYLKLEKYFSNGLLQNIQVMEDIWGLKSDLNPMVLTIIDDIIIIVLVQFLCILDIGLADQPNRVINL